MRDAGRYPRGRATNRARTSISIRSGGGCRVVTREYFYHVGSRAEYRHPVTEALLVNYEAAC